MPKISREARKMRIKSDLSKILKRDGKTGSHWSDLMDDYLAFWEIKEKLKTEISRNGVMINYKNGSQAFRKKNDAVVELPRIHKRMTEILEVLNIRADLIQDDDDEDY